MMHLIAPFHRQAEQDAEFRLWLETEYTPIAGGWQY
jgi:hypothetical protein